MNDQITTAPARRHTGWIVGVGSVVLVAAIAAATVGSGLLSGPLALVQEAVTHEKQAQFADVAAFRTNDMTLSTPTWLPADAHDIVFRIATDRPGNVLRMDSASAPTGCRAVDRTARSDLEVAWLPGQGTAGWDCDGDWWVQRHGDHLIGWTHA